jgi:hypothetical protein
MRFQRLVFFILINGLIPTTTLAAEKIDSALKEAVVKKFSSSLEVVKAEKEKCAAPAAASEPSITLLHNHTLDYSNAYEPILVIQEYKCGSNPTRVAALIPTNVRYNFSTKAYEYAMKSPEVVTITFKNKI